MTGCVMFFTRTCSAKKITRTISSNLNDFVENMPGFDPRICYGKLLCQSTFKKQQLKNI